MNYPATIFERCCRPRLRRNRGQRGYRPLQADRLARERQAGKRSRPKVVVGVVKEEVEARLRIKHSPEQISNALNLSGLKVSHEAIYQHIARDKKAGGNLAPNLRINVSGVRSAFHRNLLRRVHKCHSLRIYDAYEVRPPCEAACRCAP